MTEDRKTAHTAAQHTAGQQAAQQAGEMSPQLQEQNEKLLNARRRPPETDTAPTPSTVAQKVEAAAPPKEIENSIGMKLAYISPGKFLMGTPGDTEEEYPHEVELTQPYWMGIYPVTQAEYEWVMKRNPSVSRGPNLPVENVNWNEAIEFCEELSSLPEETKAGRIYRLPTEAEWENACRAGTTTAFHFGDSLTFNQANFHSHRPKTSAVGSFKANAWGLHDMHGNVWEWCADWFDKNYQNQPPSEPFGSAFRFGARWPGRGLE